MEVFIDYLYTGKISEGNITENLFLVAHRYMDPTLKNVYREKPSKSLSVRNAARRFSVFLECQEDILIEETGSFVVKNFNDTKIQLNFKLVLENSKAISAVFDILGNFKNSNACLNLNVNIQCFNVQN